MNVPNQALRYILLQRTQYSLTEKYLLPNIKVHSVLPPGIFKLIIAAEARLRKNAIKQLFESDMQSEYDVIRPHLPVDARAILDIGSGIGGIDLLLYNHYTKKPHIYLLDKSTETPGLYYGFETEASYYNSLSLATEFLIKNNVAPEHIHTEEATDSKTIAFETQFDLILSLLSWGFHYPVETYLEIAHTKLAPQGVLILDIRKGRGAEEKIRARFGNLTVIAETHKTAKIKAVKLA